MENLTCRRESGLTSLELIDIVRKAMDGCTELVGTLIVSHDSDEKSFLSTIARLRALELAYWTAVSKATGRDFASFKNAVDDATDALALSHILIGQLSKDDANIVFPGLKSTEVIEALGIKPGNRVNVSESTFDKAYETLRTFLVNREREKSR